ncbi:MAG: bacillithiol biosynthesis cysteine-adding enzyme BshC [Acidobacteriota bacterium]
MKVHCLDHRRLPGQNSLFLRYLYEPDQVEEFYSPVHTSFEKLEQRLQAVLKRTATYPREHLTNLLEQFNRKLGASEALLKNIEMLKSPRTVAVVTGQQVGLFGGPALTIYKAATTVRLAQILQEQGHSVVPVFWLASDDSDFEEARTSTFFDSEDRLLRIRCDDQQANSRMVGTIPLACSTGCLESLQARVSKGSFREEILQQLKKSYSTGRSFREGFAFWLAELFRDSGLILFDPLIPGYKQFLGPALSVAVKHREGVIEALQKQSNRLAVKGYTPQVQVQDDETLLFWIEGHSRYKLQYLHGRYQARQKRSVQLSSDQLLNTISQSADRLGPNVLLRPLVQDQLFPTLVYIGGPAEIAYFAQIAAISPFWNTETAVFPRAGLTIVDKKVQRLLAKYQLEPTDIFESDPHALAERLLARGHSGPVLNEFDEISSDLANRLESLQGGIAKSDPTVAEMLSRSQRKIFYQVNKVRRRFIANQSSRASHIGRHLDYLYLRLYPNQSLQERVINFNHFLMEEGPEFVHRLMPHIQPFCNGHHLVYV